MSLFPEVAASSSGSRIGPRDAQAPEAMRQVAPFAAALLLALGVVAMGPAQDHLDLVAIAFGLFLALTLSAAVVPWGRFDGVVRVLPVYGVFPIIALIRHAEGGVASAYAPLIALPLLWLALYANRRQLVAGLVLGAATLALPAVVLGPPLYPHTEWARVAVYVVLAPVACFVVHNLVSRVQAQTHMVETLRYRLALTEESFRAAFADAPAAQFMCAPTGALLRVNDAMCDLVRLEHEDLLGAETADLFAPGDASRVDALLLALWTGDVVGPTELEVRVAGSADEELFALLRLAVVSTDGGRPLFLLGHALDVTARVAEAREKDIRAAGARAVREATQRLTDLPEARQLVCEAAVDLTSARAAVLMEGDGAGSLITTAKVGCGSGGVVRIGREQSHAATTLASHDAILAAAGDPGVDEPLAGIDGVGSVLFEPILHEGVAAGVLAIAWPHAPADVPDEALVAAHLLAAETAAVIARSDHLESLTRLAHEDALTGLPNRRVLEEELPRKMASALRDRGPLCVALIDLDHFKAYNDQHGHQAGDRMLLQAASAWRGQLRASDILVRYGGEEFAVVLPRCDGDRAVALLERLRESTPSGTTCSVGVAVWDGAEPVEQLLERADRALYVAKRDGRNRTSVAGKHEKPQISAA